MKKTIMLLVAILVGYVAATIEGMFEFFVAFSVTSLTMLVALIVDKEQQ